ncbi:trypsin, alkaline A-like [Manduca sexta]|uniref:trypsin, alkaline A-like n=1 Tax=Manduca sexta TaxID=7130 RepID=UPI00188FB271|nr:trypsin, alkaline A-like [Manduca sexta]
MKVVIVFLGISLGAVVDCLELVNKDSSPVPVVSPRIVGGEATKINSYPHIASLQHRYYLFFWYHECSGTIITSRAILTSAYCLDGWGADKWRASVGSSYSGSGGTKYRIASIVIHPRFNRGAITNDIAIMRTSILMTFTNLVQPARIPPNPNFVVENNKPVEAAGWGPIYVSIAFQ